MKPTPDKLTVLSIASVLLDNQSEVTTLEVKQALRKHGFYAKQTEVSDLMKDIAHTEGWAFKDNGTYRSYHLATPVTLTSSPSSATPITVTPTSGSILTAPVTGCWEANSVTNSHVMYIDGSKSRDEVRQIYKSTYKVKWEDTRSRRVK